MRIVQFLPSLELGGMERLVIDLARQQKAAGHESSIYCMRHSGTLAALSESAGIPVVEFGKPPGLSFSLVRKLARQLKADRPDVLHTHNALVHHYGVAAARLAGVPVIVNTRHGYGSLAWDYRREAMFSAMMPWTDTVVLVSTGVQQYFIEERGIASRNTRVILNGASIDEFLSKRANPGGNRPVFRFGTVGRLTPIKGHVHLISAFAQVLREMPEAELHILGEGEIRTEIEATIVREQLQGRAILHGYSSDVAGFLSTLDTFVLSSLSEGLPLAVLEAMAAGLPLVSTRLPGIVEVAPEGEFAWYCDPGDPQSLAAAMLAVARRTDLAAISGAASKQAQHYSIAQTWREYEGLFCELLAAKSSSRVPDKKIA